MKEFSHKPRLAHEGWRLRWKLRMAATMIAAMTLTKLILIIASRF